MNKQGILKINIIIAVFVLACFSPAGTAYSISSRAEFLSHTKDSDACLTDTCHADMTRNKQFLHKPVTEDRCSSCHRADSYPDKLGIKSRNHMCSECHKKMEDEVLTSKFIHGPVKSGDCLACHDPHDSDQPFFLRRPYSQLCSTCHKLEKMVKGKSVHQPVKDGNCGLCHDPHASDYNFRLTAFGANLCVGCHDNFVTGMTKQHIHEPLLKTGCSDCHDPHSGEDSIRLKSPAEEICFRCHKEKKTEVDHYAISHEPAVKGHCTACHSPHFSDNSFLLSDQQNALCYACHKDSKERDSRRFKHGPVVQGNCSACHNPHGSDNAYILRLAFPHTFYSVYEKGKYDLCFFCHKEAMVTVKETTTVTNFRNGKKNLHWFHVNQEKGRTCRACHDVHASNHEGRIRDEFPFGNVRIPMEYSQTETGGSCLPGCHREKAYDRIHEVRNEK
ncbi:MAG: hypothetical protein JSW20_07780 [Nitrospiraceae bacterium]|nr:MAG: hypothetical protein JSW20_07780 [Nitrospiraceae bacterium]